MRKINLVLEIDGVLSPSGTIDHEAFAVYPTSWTTWRVPYDTVTFLHGIKDEVNLVNSSAWEHDAAGLYRYMLLPEPEFVFYREALEGSWLKEQSITQYVLDRPFDYTIILDSEFSGPFIDWAEKHSEVELVPVVAERGLDTATMETVLQLIEAESERDNFIFGLQEEASGSEKEPGESTP